MLSFSSGAYASSSYKFFTLVLVKATHLQFLELSESHWFQIPQVRNGPQPASPIAFSSLPRPVVPEDSFFSSGFVGVAVHHQDASP